MSDVDDQFDNDDIEDPSVRLSIMEKKYKVVADHTITVSKLSAKVSLLLTVMSFAVVIVSGAAVYTFTSLNGFKDVYNNNRLEVHQLINNTQITNRNLIEDSIKDLDHTISARITVLGKEMDDKIDDIDDKMDKRMDKIEQQYTELRAKFSN